MTLKHTIYRTLTGTKEIFELPNKKNTQWIVYLNNLPAYFVDCFDLKTEANLIMNSLVLGNQKPIEDVLKRIGKKNNVKLSVKKTPLIEIKVKSELKECNLEPLPLKWLN